MIDYYRQCQVRRGTEHQVVWLPERFARPRKWLRLDEEDHWQVEIVYLTRLTEKELMERSQDYKKTREASDI